MALIVVLLTMMLLSALGMALSLAASTETKIAASHTWSAETFYAADAGIERALEDLARAPDWTAVLSGAATSSFVDGAPGVRTLPDGTRVGLNEETSVQNCAQFTCSDADLVATTDERPWGANNPRWRLYAHGPLESLGASRPVRSTAYIVVWVSDDPLETDSQPTVDGDDTAGPNPGRDLLQLRAQAYGPSGARRIVEVTARRAASRVRVISWREIRE